MQQSYSVILDKYCVYYHKDDKGKIFYVGCGISSRPFVTSGRSQRWKDCVASLKEFKIEIVSYFDDLREAIRLEKQEIDRLKPFANSLNPLENRKVYRRISSRLTQKRYELVWALMIQDYSQAQIGRIFNLDRSTVMRIFRKKPSKWIPPWVKREDK